MAACVCQGSLADLHTESGKSLLHLACEGLCFLKRSAGEHLQCVEYLLDKVPVDQAEPKSGRTCLQNYEFCFALALFFFTFFVFPHRMPLGEFARATLIQTCFFGDLPVLRWKTSAGAHEILRLHQHTC